MPEIMKIGQPALEILLRRSARARRLSLRISRLDGRISMTLPRFVPLAEARGFAEEREAWLRAQLAQIPPSRAVQIGQTIPLRGQEIVLAEGPSAAPALEGAQLFLPKGKPAGAVLRAFLREEARADLAAATAHYAGQIGRAPGRLTLRDTRSRWGSCNAQGDLMFSWRLVMAPPSVLAYVAAHEVAHLEEMNHSPAFWAIVARLMPGWRAERDWLRQHGGSLFALRFDD